MLIFEQFVGRGFTVLDPVRKVLVFNREVVGKFPAIRKAKMEEFRWLVGEWSAMNKVRATPSTPAYTDTYFYSYQLCEADTRISITGSGGMARPYLPYLTFDPFRERWMMTSTEFSVRGAAIQRVAARLDCLHRMPDHIGSGLRDSPDHKQAQCR
jgi:hypothetical protein